MTDKQIIDDVHILYICNYGQSALPICVDLEHRYCKLKSQKSKKCNLRPVVSYKEYKRKEQEYNKLKQILTDIEFWVREFLKRTGQVVPNEIMQILQKINESEVENN